MTLFVGPLLNEGFAAASAAQRANAEISEVLGQLSAELNEASGGKFSVKEASVDSYVSGLGSSSLGVPAGMPYPSTPGLCLVWRDGRTQRTVPLFGFERAPSGYPVAISIAGRSDHAFNRETLIETLQDALRHPTVAGRVQMVWPQPR